MLSNTKKLLIQEFLDTPTDTLKSTPVDDLHIETLQEFFQSPECDIELFHACMKKFHEIYRDGRKNENSDSESQHLRLLVLSVIPSLLAIYIRVAHNYYPNPRSDFDALSVLLLFVYNLEVTDLETGRPKVIDIRQVSLQKPSIYHEPGATYNSIYFPGEIRPGAALPTELTLRSIPTTDQPKLRIFGPYDELEQLNSANYWTLATVLLKVYNQTISKVGSHSLGALCRYALRLLRQGTKIDVREKIHQYLFDEVSSIKLPQLTRSVYFCIYNDFYDLGVEVLQEICTRATLAVNSDLLLMVNAIKNSLAIKNSREQGCELEGAVGNQTRSLQKNVRQIRSKAHGHDFYSIARKAAITTASFKTRKLPDDIPIVHDPNENVPQVPPNNSGPVPGKAFRSGHKNLDSIHEEPNMPNGDTSGQGKQLRKKESQESSSKMPSAAKTKVMNILKESKAKLAKVGHSGGQSLSNLKNESRAHMQTHKNGLSHESDASSLNDSITKLSLNDSFNAADSDSQADSHKHSQSYQMSVFHRKRSKSIGRYADEDDFKTNGQSKSGHSLLGYMHGSHGNNQRKNRKDSFDGNSSDRSGSSSKSLLAKTKSFDSDKNTTSGASIMSPPPIQLTSE